MSRKAKNLIKWLCIKLLGWVAYAIFYFILVRSGTGLGQLLINLSTAPVRWGIDLFNLEDAAKLPQRLEASNFEQYEWVFWLGLLVSMPFAWAIYRFGRHMLTDPADIYVGQHGSHSGGGMGHQPQRYSNGGATVVNNIHHHYPASNSFMSTLFKGALLIIMFMLVVHATANVFFPIYQSIVVGPEEWTQLEVNTDIYEGSADSIGESAKGGTASLFSVTVDGIAGLVDIIVSAFKWTIIAAMAVFILVIGVPYLIMFIGLNSTFWTRTMHRIPGSLPERLRVARTIFFTIYAFVLIVIFLIKM